MKKSQVFLLIGTCSFTLSACDVSNSDSLVRSNESHFVLTSSAMTDGSHLPITYTCDGESITPPFSWNGAPQETKYYALMMHHNAPDGVYSYWNLYNIDASNEQVKSDQILGEIGTNNLNDLNEYSLPCSQGPGDKNYTYTIYALSEAVTLNSQSKVDRDMLLGAIKNITLSSAEMTVSYARNNTAILQNKKNSSLAKELAENASITPSVNTARCDVIKNSIDDAGFEKNVTVTCDNDYAYIASSTYPEHELMNGITGTNEQIPVPAEGYAAPIKLIPNKANALTTIDAAVGVAVNGVPIYDYSAQGELDVSEYDAKHDTLALGQLDNCGGHSGRGDDYHYHVSPTCMIDTMKNQASDVIIGWAYDGYPLYGNKNPDGSDIKQGELDVCNGQADETFGYRYQTSVTAPYIIQCLVGEVDTSKLPRVAPLSGDIQKIRADLKPPRGGVDNLTHTILENGSRKMTYSYQGEDYFTTYSPSVKGEYCYDFKQKTISNGGKIQTGTFCRGSQSSNHQPVVTN